VRQGDSWTLSGARRTGAAGDCADTLVVSAALPAAATGCSWSTPRKTARHPAAVTRHSRPAAAASASTGQHAGRTSSATTVDAAPPIRDTIVRIQCRIVLRGGWRDGGVPSPDTDYLKTRKQFGVTLNKFQALTRRCAATCTCPLELARSMRPVRAMSIADGNLDPVIASRAKLQIGRYGRPHRSGIDPDAWRYRVTAEYPVSHYAARLTGNRKHPGALRTTTCTT